MKYPDLHEDALRLAAQAKAQQMWDAMTPNEKAGVRLGLFPGVKMIEAAREGHGSRLLAVALMNCAEEDGGMRA